jgi:hypothetical protein
MTFDDRVKTVAEFGFSERQAHFLVTVMPSHANSGLVRTPSSTITRSITNRRGIDRTRRVPLPGNQALRRPLPRLDPQAVLTTRNTVSFNGRTVNPG